MLGVCLLLGGGEVLYDFAHVRGGDLDFVLVADRAQVFVVFGELDGD